MRLASCINEIALTVLLSFPSFAAAATAHESNYKGWKTLELKNEYVSAQLAPDIGGRIIQFQLGDHEFLWVNKDLAGKMPPDTGLGPKGEWLNYGGDKLWPAPQGWSGPDEWPGPPGADIEGKPHKASIVTAQGTTATIMHISPKDPYSGIQFSRRISVTDGAAGLRIESTMTNVDTKPRRWGIWEVTQLGCEAADGKGWNKDAWAYSPINPKSIFPKGFKVLYGPENNPAWQPDAKANMFRAHYVRQVGKVGLDSMAGWLAFADGQTGHVLVERFATFPEKKYPDNASVEFWLQAPGSIVTGGKETVIKDTPQDAPPYMEAEVLSPFAELKQGDSYTFRNEWYATTLDKDWLSSPISHCTENALILEPVECVYNYWNGQLWFVRLEGRLGVFRTGKLGIRLVDQKGFLTGSVITNVNVRPDVPLDLSKILKSDLADALKLKHGRRGEVILFIADPKGNSLGELARGKLDAALWHGYD
jgi:hypothetical protein